MIYLYIEYFFCPFQIYLQGSLIKLDLGSTYKKLFAMGGRGGGLKRICKKVFHGYPLKLGHFT